MYSTLQKYLWQLAGYDSFNMSYCSPLYNRIAGVGIYYLLQMMVVFASTVLLYYNLFPSYYWIGWLLACVVAFGFSKYTKLTNRVHHHYQSGKIMVNQFIISALIAFIIAIPFCVTLFQTEIIYHIYQKTGKLNIGIIEQAWLKPYGLYLSWLNDDAASVVIAFCSAVWIMLFFLFFMPYLLIFQTRKSLYYIIKKNYEQNFI